MLESLLLHYLNQVEGIKAALGPKLSINECETLTSNTIRKRCCSNGQHQEITNIVIIWIYHKFFTFIS